MKKRWVLCAFFLLISFGYTLTGDAEIYTSISGKVIAEDTRQGIAGVSVVTQREEDGKYGKSYSATTNEKGIYVLNDLKTGTYLLGFSKDGSPYISVNPYLKVILPVGKNVVNVNHTLILGGSVSGAISYKASGPVPSDEAMVMAKVPNTPKEWVNENGDLISISQGGRFLLQGLPESDNCIVTVEAHSIYKQTKTVKIQKGKITENVNFVINWDDITGISGTVKSSIDNRPFISFGILLRDMSGNAVAQTITDATGKYYIRSVPPGVYIVNVLHIAIPREEWIEKNNIIVEQGKSTEVNFEFNK
jgi:hypothetical protein